MTGLHHLGAAIGRGHHGLIGIGIIRVGDTAAHARRAEDLIYRNAPRVIVGRDGRRQIFVAASSGSTTWVIAGPL